MAVWSKGNDKLLGPKFAPNPKITPKLLGKKEDKDILIVVVKKVVREYATLCM